MRFRKLCAPVLVLAVLTAACSNDKTQVRANAKGTTSSAQPDAAGDRLTEMIRSTDAIGVMLTPPPDSATPVVSSDDAAAAVVKVFGNSAAKELTPKLAIMNNKIHGAPPEQASGAEYINRLVWAFVGYGDCAPLRDSLAGPPRADGQERVTPTTEGPPVTCIGVITVDGNTGEYLMAYNSAKDAYQAEQRGIQELQKQQESR